MVVEQFPLCIRFNFTGNNVITFVIKRLVVNWIETYVLLYCSIYPVNILLEIGNWKLKIEKKKIWFIIIYIIYCSQLQLLIQSFECKKSELFTSNFQDIHNFFGVSTHELTKYIVFFVIITKVLLQSYLFYFPL